MHATGAENGELWCRTGITCLPVIRGVQNLQIYYVVVLREKGAAYYAASVADANGLGAYPYLRLLAIDPFETASPVYPGVFQAALGQIGFRLDTRVYNARVDYLPGLAAWYGSAHAADTLKGVGDLNGSTADAGGAWRVAEGEFRLSSEGVRPCAAGSNRAVLDLGNASGLLHAICTPDGADGVAGLTWRYQDQNNFWQLLLGASRCQISATINGVREVVAADERPCFVGRRPHSIQILDDGAQIGIAVDGRLLFGRRFIDRRLADATGSGIWRRAISRLHPLRPIPARSPCRRPSILGDPGCARGSVSWWPMISAGTTERWRAGQRLSERRSGVAISASAPWSWPAGPSRFRRPRNSRIPGAPHT